MISLELQAARAISKARQIMVAEHPFFAVLALSMKPTAKPLEWWPKGNNTMATNGDDLFYSPEWVLSIKAPEVIGVVAHEALHKANCHHTRRGNRIGAIWQLATDAVINRDLLRAGFKLPPCGFNLTGPDPYAGMSAEQAYAKMVRDGMTEAKAQAILGEGGGWGGILDAAAPGDEDARAEAETAAQTLVRQAVMVAKASSGPGDAAVIARLVGDLSAPRRSWREAVASWAQDSSNKDYSYARPNKRYLQAGLIVPSLRPINPAHIVFALDTSGSMDKRAVDACLAEVQGALDEGACDRVTVVYCDSEVHGSETWESGEIIAPKPIGGGGTRFSPVWKWVAENVEDVSGVIYLTDLGTTDWGCEPDYPVLWASYGTPAIAPFGETIRIDPHA